MHTDRATYRLASSIVIVRRAGFSEYWQSSCRIDVLVVGVDVRLVDASEGTQMPDRVIAEPVPQLAVQCRR